MGIADEKYISLTTYRKNGDGVATAVWIAPLPDGRAGFTTGSDSGKVKRIGNNPRVTVRPCDMRGKVAEGAVEVSASAVFVTGDDAEPVARAIKTKYKVMVTFMRIGAAVAKVFGKGEAGNAAIILTFDATP